LLASNNDAIAAAVAANLGIWKAKGVNKDLSKVLSNSSKSDSVRQAAAEAMGALGLAETRMELIRLSKDGDTKSRFIATHGLAYADLTDAANSAAILLAANPENADPIALVSMFIQREGGVVTLGKALAQHTPHPTTVEKLAAFHRQTGQLPKTLAAIFTPTIITSLSEALLREDRKSLTADVEKLGLAAAGELVFRRQASACAACHGIGSVGPAIGPNLVAVGAAADTAYMIEAILEPNKSIAEHYENTMFMLNDGMVQTGVITHKTDREVVIRDSTIPDGEIHIPISNIRKTKTMASLMPAGLANQLTSRQEFLDLAKFLSQLGKPGHYANNESPVIRKWRVISEATPGVIPSEDEWWTPAYSKVNGELPATDLDESKVVYAQGYIEILVAGSVQLNLNNSRGLRLWIDGEEIKNPTAPIALTRGRKTLTFAVNQGKRGKSGLRVELAQAPGSKAKFKPEGGI
ncbi:c-type cytochrome, partial [bacterium]|nr:c-type cytochrome [bacterium]